MVIRVKDCPPPPFCTPYHEPIVCVIYHLFSQIIVEIILDLRHPSYALVFQLDTNHIHCKKIGWPLQPIFSTQLFFHVKTFLVSPIVPINFSTCAVVDLYCDWICFCQLNHIGICFWGRFFFPPSHASVRPPFLRQSPSKNELPTVPIHPNKITQHRICPVYRHG